LSHVHEVTGHTFREIDEHMDMILVFQFEAIYWQQKIHEDEISAAIALSMFCGAKPQHRIVVGLADTGERELL
jgi:hypothetical protein